MSMTPAKQFEHTQQINRDRQIRFYEKNKARLAEGQKIKKQLDIQVLLKILDQLEKRPPPKMQVQQDLLDLQDVQDIQDIQDIQNILDVMDIQDI